jgi:ribosomal protein S18 acetylase RimI-like enzyme
MLSATFRPASEADVPFLVDCILLAEGAGAGPIAYQQLFGLDDHALRALLTDICEVELMGCELCYPNFYVAEVAGQPAAATAAWIESLDGIPSGTLKAQLLAQVLGAERFLAARPMLELLSTIDIPRTPGALQLDAIAVLDAYRGKGLLQHLLSHIEADFSARQPAPEHVQILLMRENLRALSAYEKAGYRVVTETHSDDPIIPTLVPGTGRLLLTKAL